VIEISNRIWIGNQEDAEYGWRYRNNWAFVHACKEPWHRQFVGYKTRAAPKDSEEYYYAIRGREIALNMVDVENPDWFHMDTIKLTMGFISKYVEHYNVLIHCNQGESRSPSLGLLYLATVGEIPNESFNIAELTFAKKYKLYNPKPGIREHLKKHWEDYMTVPNERSIV
jgi:hypothetical protein